MRLLLVEDDVPLCEALLAGLRPLHAIDWVETAEDADLALRTVDYDLLLLDINLPGMSGLALLEELRNRGVGLPTLLLTARDRIEDRVRGLDAGADDYLTKPFDFDELLARIRALLRRSGHYSGPTITRHDVVVDTQRRTVTRGGALVRMSRTEYAILAILIQNIGQCFAKGQIEEKIYGWDAEVESNTVEVHISSIRRKLGKDFIVTIRGVGYMIPGD